MERDENNAIRELLGIFISEQGGGAKMKLHSNLTWEPPTDVIETEKEVVILVDIAGMNGKDIDVVTDGKVLKICGLRRNKSYSGDKHFHKLEIQVGHFEREIELPFPVDHSKVSAHYKNGILEVKLRKFKSSERTKKVQID